MSFNPEFEQISYLLDEGETTRSSSSSMSDETYTPLATNRNSWTNPPKIKKVKRPIGRPPKKRTRETHIKKRQYTPSELPPHPDNDPMIKSVGRPRLRSSQRRAELETEQLQTNELPMEGIVEREPDLEPVQHQINQVPMEEIAEPTPAQNPEPEESPDLIVVAHFLPNSSTATDQRKKNGTSSQNQNTSQANHAQLGYDSQTSFYANYAAYWLSYFMSSHFKPFEQHVAPNSPYLPNWNPNYYQPNGLEPYHYPLNPGGTGAASNPVNSHSDSANLPSTSSSSQQKSQNGLCFGPYQYSLNPVFTGAASNPMIAHSDSANRPSTSSNCQPNSVMAQNSSLTPQQSFWSNLQCFQYPAFPFIPPGTTSIEQPLPSITTTTTTNTISQNPTTSYLNTQTPPPPPPIATNLLNVPPQTSNQQFSLLFTAISKLIAPAANDQQVTQQGDKWVLLGQLVAKSGRDADEVDSEFGNTIVGEVTNIITKCQMSSTSSTTKTCSATSIEQLLPTVTTTTTKTISPSLNPSTSHLNTQAPPPPIATNLINVPPQTSNQQFSLLFTAISKLITPAANVQQEDDKWALMGTLVEKCCRKADQHDPELGGNIVGELIGIINKCLMKTSK